ncbi:LacI family DNA-binding transcriptional regulator [Bifidobacterium sp. SO4]|uniref:LacI family DNA-binding transcriptional regulator n=1 Tax=Bifidobacterium sp. SO4 TaxID=2809030 RepID=UPI001BDC9B5F|nr:LacI family DNA-binding transcriptional regulator [Bifidobacterium sp. SO4]MBT1169711.1 LacI family DNA-binding transcriptional regulator [Bifidobacterium sp. SO4]
MTKASIQAVAREAGVSVSTVSRTFAKPDLVLPETRDKVMAAAEKLDYSVSRSAAALKSGQSFRVALLASETITTWFNSNIFAGLDSTLRPAGYDTVVYPMSNADERRSFFEDLPVRRNADAVIVSSFNIEPAEVERLKHMHVPIIGINIPSTEGFDAAVSIDDRAATRAASEHLIALGHHSIAYVGGTRSRTTMRYSAESRLQGLLDATATHPGVSVRSIEVPRDTGETNAALNAVLTATPGITAFCFCDDDMALPVLYRLRQYGRRVPQDLSIIGFDDVPMAQSVGLTTLHQDPFAMGQDAGRMTLAAIAGEPVEPAFRQPATPLVLRETTAPPQSAQS